MLQKINANKSKKKKKKRIGASGIEQELHVYKLKLPRVTAGLETEYMTANQETKN